MTCEQARVAFCEYLDNELDAKELGSFESHIDSCPECRREVGELREAVDWLKQAEDVVPPTGLRQAVIEKIKKENQIKTSHRFNPVIAQVAAAAVFIFLVAGNITLSLSYPAAMPRSTDMMSAPAAQEQEVGTMGLEIQPESGPAEPDALPPLRQAESAEDSGEEGMLVAGSDDDAQISTEERSIARRRFNTPRIILNAALLPLFAVFSWLAVRKRKE